MGKILKNSKEDGEAEYEHSDEEKKLGRGVDC
jgi:hypothetical protein